MSSTVNYVTDQLRPAAMKAASYDARDATLHPSWLLIAFVVVHAALIAPTHLTWNYATRRLIELIHVSHHKNHKTFPFDHATPLTHFSS